MRAFNRTSLVTGATGFIGSFLCEYLIEQGERVIGTKYELDPLPEDANFENVKLASCDIRDRKVVKSLIRETSPDIIFHLAAQSYLTVSWQDPWLTIDTNVIGTLNVLEAVRELELDPKIIISCSSGEYGETASNGLPLTEDDPLLPLNPYGVSKVAQDLLSFQYYKNYGLNIIRPRLFGTIGPRKRSDFCADFCKQIVRIERGLQEPILYAGNLNSRRDLTSIWDMVRALFFLSKKGLKGEVYNICTGRSYRIGDLLDILLSFTSDKIQVQIDKSRFRSSDEPIILGDNSKIKNLCQWRPEITIETTLRRTLDYWRSVFAHT